VLLIEVVGLLGLLKTFSIPGKKGHSSSIAFIQHRTCLLWKLSRSAFIVQAFCTVLIIRTGVIKMIFDNNPYFPVKSR